MEIISNSVQETQLLGKNLGALLQSGDCICMDGDLGAGKTHLTKAIAEGLGIAEEVTSPTFTIVQEYSGRLPLFHFDMYRLADSEELYAIGFLDYLNQGGVLIMEWSKNVEEALPQDRLDIQLAYTLVENQRLITLEATGPKSARLLDQLEEIKI